MRTKKIFLTIFALFLVTPIFATLAAAYIPQTSQPQTSQDDRVDFIKSEAGSGGLPTHWDPTVSNHYGFEALEPLVWVDRQYNVRPLLATNWTTYYRADDGSGKSGGIKAIAISLRQGVEFHDGSDFNASVVKWNLDRMTYVSGFVNLTWNSRYWFDPSGLQASFSPSWDLSWAIRTGEVSFIETDNWASILDGEYINYTSNYYIYFDTTGANATDPMPAGRMPIYCNISASTVQENVSDVLGAAIGAVSGISATNTDDNVTITNDNYGDITDIADVDSGLTVSTVSDGNLNPHYGAASNKVPMFNTVEVVNDYLVNITMNKWAFAISLFPAIQMISMQAYGGGIWEDEGIGGWGPSFPHERTQARDPDLVHCIGTGPYIFQSNDPIDLIQHSIKNENYWNKTALEANNEFVVDDFYTRYYATTQARTAALLAGDVDGSTHMYQARIEDLPGVILNPNIDYYPGVHDASIDVNQFTTTEMQGLPAPQNSSLTNREFIEAKLGIEMAAGLNRTERQALSWAFDYDTYISVAYSSGSGLKCRTPMGAESMYRDDSVPTPIFNTTRAREILLSDPGLAANAAARGLTISSTDAEWQAVATSNPIRVLTMLQSVDSPKTDHMNAALRNIGYGTILTESNNIYIGYMLTGLAYQFDIWSYIWLNDKEDPLGFYGSGLNLIYNSAYTRISGYGFNFAGTSNSTIDGYLADAAWADEATKQQLFNNFTYDIMNYHCPMIYLGHYQMGVALNAGWNITSAGFDKAGPSGVQYYIVHIGGERLDISPPAPFIPGFPAESLGIFSLLAMVGLVYVTMKKRRK